jgi:hypothetical protein
VVRRLFVPSQARQFTIGSRKGYRSGCIGGSAGARKATNGASAVVFATLTALIGGLIRREPNAAANFGSAQWIGSGDSGRPRHAYGCKDLHP